MPGGAGTPGGYDGGAGFGGSGGGGGGGGGHHVDTSAARRADAARAAAAASAAAQAEADRLNAARAAEAIARENEARETAREKAIQTAALTPKTIPETRHHSADTPLQVLEQVILDKDSDWEFQDTKATAPTTLKPKIKTYERGVPFTNELVKTVTPPKVSPTYYQDRSRIGGETWGERAEAGIKRGMGLGTLAKGALTALAWPVASAFLPKDMMTALTWGKRAKDIKEGKGIWGYAGKKIGLDKKVSHLTSTIDKARKRRFDPDSLLGTPDWQGEKKRTFHDPKGDGEATLTKIVAGGEDVVTKTVNQFAGTEAESQIANLVKTNLNRALHYYSMMTPKIEAGKANKQEMDAYELLGYYLNERAPKAQNVAYGGRIDKALTGRSRDI